MKRRAALVTKEECESIPIREFVLQVINLIKQSGHIAKPVVIS